METPSIGCAKKILVGEYEEPSDDIGSVTDIWDGEPIGYAFRSMQEANPIFISAGHKISRENILPIIRELVTGEFKLPLPVHFADKLAGNERKLLSDLVSAFNGEDGGIFLVGGAVRDLLVGRIPTDYDLLVTTFSDSVRTVIEETFESEFFVLDEERNIHRLVGDDMQLDVTVVDEESVVEDLMRRDFTLNSIALDMTRENWVDPASGREDIKQEIIRPTGETSLKDDPVRLLRAFRLSTDLDFSLSDELLTSVGEVLDSLKNVSKERIVEELLKIASQDFSLETFSHMQESGILSRVDLFRQEGLDDAGIIDDWRRVLQGYPHFEVNYHGEYSMLDGFQAGRFINRNNVSSWPFHAHIKEVLQSSYQSLANVPNFEILQQSHLKLLGKLFGRGLSEEWETDRMGEAYSRLQRYLEDRNLLEKEIVNSLVSVEDQNIGALKKEELRNELPGLWENRVSPILGDAVRQKTA